MEKLMCLVLFLAVFITAGNALSCYQCISNDAETCKAQRRNQTCPGPSQFNKVVCLSKETLDTRTKDVTVIQRCEQVASHVDVDKDDYEIDLCKNVGAMQVRECNVCQKDLCNFATRSAVNVFSFLGIPLIFLVLTKYLL